MNTLLGGMLPMWAVWVVQELARNSRIRGHGFVSLQHFQLALSREDHPLHARALEVNG